MKKKYKILLLVFGIFLVLSIVLGSSYAIWIYSASQSGINVLNSDCFEITFTDGNDINLNSAIPLSEEEGRALTPYTFTIKNICNHIAGYNVNVETLNTSTLDTNYVRYKINNKNSKILGSIDNNSNSVIVNSNVSSSKTIESGVLTENEEKTFNLRLWIDDDSTKEQSANKSYKSKIVVNATLKKDLKEATVMSSRNFWNELSNVRPNNSRATKILQADSLPNDSVNKANVSETPDVPVYAWYDNDVIYLYSDADKVYSNSDCSSMFSSMFNSILGDFTELDLSMFDTSRVTDMSWMFSDCEYLESLDLSNFDTSNVTKMNGMFHMEDRSPILKSLDLSSFDTSKVTDMNSMFYGIDSLESLNVSSFDTSNVTDMSYMFGGLNRLKSLDLGNFNTSNVTDMSYMFGGCNDLESLNVSNFDTSKVTNMNSMFAYNRKLKTLDLSSFDTSNVERMSSIFSENNNLETIYVSNKWSTAKVSGYPVMFANDTKLVGGAGTTYSSVNMDKEYARIDDPTNGNPGYFTSK